MSAIVVDVGARLVRREGIDVHLAPKAFELLLILVRNFELPAPESESREPEAENPEARSRKPEAAL